MIYAAPMLTAEAQAKKRFHERVDPHHQTSDESASLIEFPTRRRTVKVITGAGCVVQLMSFGDDGSLQGVAETEDLEFHFLDAVGEGNGISPERFDAWTDAAVRVLQTYCVERDASVVFPHDFLVPELLGDPSLHAVDDFERALLDPSRIDTAAGRREVAARREAGFSDLVGRDLERLGQWVGLTDARPSELLSQAAAEVEALFGARRHALLQHLVAVLTSTLFDEYNWTEPADRGRADELIGEIFDKLSERDPQLARPLSPWLEDEYSNLSDQFGREFSAPV
jgi:hypothetical protein